MTGFVVMFDCMWVHVSAVLDKKKFESSHKSSQNPTVRYIVIIKKSAVFWRDCYFAEQLNVINNAVLTNTTINKF